MELESIVMTLNTANLEKDYYYALRQIPTAKARNQAREEILSRFSTEPDELHQWSEQDITEQIRKIIQKYC